MKIQFNISPKCALQNSHNHVGTFTIDIDITTLSMEQRSILNTLSESEKDTLIISDYYNPNLISDNTPSALIAFLDRQIDINQKNEQSHKTALDLWMTKSDNEKLIEDSFYIGLYKIKKPTYTCIDNRYYKLFDGVCSIPHEEEKRLNKIINERREAYEKIKEEKNSIKLNTYLQTINNNDFSYLIRKEDDELVIDSEIRMLVKNNDPILANYPSIKEKVLHAETMIDTILKRCRKATPYKTYKMLDNTVNTLGSSSQIERWNEGVLPIKDIINLLWDKELERIAPFYSLNSDYEQMTPIVRRSPSFIENAKMSIKKTLSGDEFDNAKKIRSILPDYSFEYLNLHNNTESVTLIHLFKDFDSIEIGFYIPLSDIE